MDATNSSFYNYGPCVGESEIVDSSYGYSPYSSYCAYGTQLNSDVGGYTSDSIRKSNEEVEGAAFSWNEEFQLALEQPALTPEEFNERSERIDNIIQDFVSFVTPIAKTIIEEERSPNKSIEPTEAGGIAGGEKYIHKGVFFKFANDHTGLFGGDNQMAMKVAALELSALKSILGTKIPNLHFPLMVLIDYMGRRLVVSSQLPISKSTIIYGSDDAGITIHNSSLKFNSIMEKLARKLNLKGHLIENKTQKVFLHGPFDLEGHLGTDGRYYVIDFSRLFPYIPEKKEERIHGSQVFRLFRGEFVLRNPVPLSSDAFMRNCKSKLDKCEVSDSRRRLFSMIPSVALDLSTTLSTSIMETNPNQLCSFLHERGINLRFLGMVYSALPLDCSLKKYVLSEIVVRTLKRLIRKDLLSVSASYLPAVRGCIWVHFHSFYENSYQYCITHLSTLQYFWNSCGNIVDESALNSLGELSDGNTGIWIFERLSDLLGIVWNRDPLDVIGTWKSGEKDESLFDTIEIRERIKSFTASDSLLFNEFSDASKASKFYQTQSDIRKKHLGENHPFVSDSLESYAVCISDTDLERSLSLLVASTQLRALLLEHFNSSRGLGKIYFESYLETCGLNESLIIQKMGKIHYIKSEIQFKKGKLEDALASLEVSTEFYTECKDAESLDLYRNWFLTGWILKGMEKWEESIEQYKKVLGQLEKNETAGEGIDLRESIFLRLQKQKTMLVCMTKIELARVMMIKYQFADAYLLQKGTLSVLEDCLGKEHSRVATIQNNIAISLCFQYQLESAIKYAEESLRIRRKKLGGNHPYVAHSLCCLSQLKLISHDMGTCSPFHIDDILPLLEEAKTIYENDSESKLPTVYFTLGRAFHLSGQWEESFRSFKECIELMEEYYGKSYLLSFVFASFAASCYDRYIQGNREEKAYFDKGRTLIGQARDIKTSFQPVDSIPLLERLFCEDNSIPRQLEGFSNSHCVLISMFGAFLPPKLIDSVNKSNHT